MSDTDSTANQLHAMGVPAELDKAIQEAWAEVIPEDVPNDEYWRLNIEKDQRLADLYDQLVAALPTVGLVSKLVLDARGGRYEAIRTARRELRAIEAAQGAAVKA